MSTHVKLELNAPRKIGDARCVVLKYAETGLKRCVENGPAPPLLRKRLLLKPCTITILRCVDDDDDVDIREM